jgi:hypothetical protein
MSSTLVQAKVTYCDIAAARQFFRECLI